MKITVQSLISIVVFSFISASCSITGFGPMGAIYTDHKIGVYGNSPSGSKTGKACTMSVLGIVAVGDGGVEDAALRAGITKVNNINLESFSILGIYGTLCTVVRGD